MTDRVDRFRAVYDATYHALLGYALRRTATADDAHDVVSETFLTAWRRLDDVPDGERARLWLYGTARRVLANHHRGRRRRERLIERLRETARGPTTEAGQDVVGRGGDAAGDDLDRQLVATAFGRLREADREVLLLAGWEALTPAETAEILDCAPGTARVRLHRARRRFAAELRAVGLPRPGGLRDGWSARDDGNDADRSDTTGLDGRSPVPDRRNRHAP